MAKKDPRVDQYIAKAAPFAPPMNCRCRMWFSNTPNRVAARTLTRRVKKN